MKEVLHEMYVGYKWVILYAAVMSTLCALVLLWSASHGGL